VLTFQKAVFLVVVEFVGLKTRLLPLPWEWRVTPPARAISLIGRGGLIMLSELTCVLLVGFKLSLRLRRARRLWRRSRFVAEIRIRHACKKWAVRRLF